MNWPKILKTIRGRLFLTQTEMAERIGVSFASVNRWEQGYHEPTMKAKKKIAVICDELNIDMESL